MTVFACKEAFVSLGLEQIKPSHAHASQDCSVCKDPLAVHPSNPTDQPSKLHAAVRIVACGHVVGKDCLDAWLDIGNSCPTCSRMLFEATGDPITQQDVNNILHQLGPEYGENEVMGVVAHLMVRQEVEHTRLRRAHEVEMGRMQEKEAQARKDGFTLSDEDFVDSDEEMDFDDGDGDLESMLDDEDISDSTE